MTKEARIIEAAKRLLARLDRITTAEFEYGGDRKEREELRRALDETETKETK